MTLLFDLPFVWFNPKILFVVFATISRSHRINRMLNCNQYVNIDMIPFMNTVASMMTTEHLFLGDILFMSAHVSPSTTRDSLSACLYFILYFIYLIFIRLYSPIVNASIVANHISWLSPANIITKLFAFFSLATPFTSLHQHTLQASQRERSLLIYII